MNGILIVNKQVGYTSRDIVNIVSKKLNTRKVGHTGTLDPLASGVLVLCIGNCLKLVELLTSDEKIYEAKVILGIETDTLDITGNILKEDKLVSCDEDRVREVLSKFIGNIIQEVPKYSAVRVNGKRLYQYARDNVDVELPKREVNIKELELISDISLNSDNRYEFMIRCRVSKGTYIRSLIRDIGYEFGSYACMGSLNRLKQGVFDISNSYTLEDINNDNFKVLNPVEVLDMEKVIVDDEMKFKVKNGQVLDSFFDGENAMILDKDGVMLAIYKRVEDNKVKPWKMF
jgi:tRNA pseudouridine55 synthase